MKQIFQITVLALAAFLPLSSPAQITFSNSPQYAAISGTPSAPATNAGAWVLIGNASILPPVYSLSHGALANTADITNIIQFSFGGTNSAITITNVSPARTNANDADAYSLASQSLTVYSRVLVVATNSVSGGAQIVKGINAVQ